MGSQVWLSIDRELKWVTKCNGNVTISLAITIVFFYGRKYFSGDTPMNCRWLWRDSPMGFMGDAVCKEDKTMLQS